MRRVGTKLFAVMAVMMMVGTLWTGHTWAADEPEAADRGILGDRFSLDAGMKFWVAKWQAAGFVNGVNSTRTSDTTALMGPSITGTMRLRDEEFFHSLGVNFTWLEAGGFDMSSFGNGTNGPTDRTSATRRDYSIVGTLAIWRGFGIFGGYYHMQQRFSSQFSTITGPAKSSVWISGPIVGVYGSGTVSGRLKAYGNLAVGFFDEKTNEAGTGVGPGRVAANGVQGYAGEMGLSYDGPSIKTRWGAIGSAVQAGFRAQIININNSPLANNDVTWGPTFQIIARF